MNPSKGVEADTTDNELKRIDRFGMGLGLGLEKGIENESGVHGTHRLTAECSFPWARPLDSDIWIGFENSQECNSKNTISFYPKFGYPLSYMLWLLKSP